MSLVICAALHAVARSYRSSHTEPKFWDVDYLRRAGGWRLVAGGWCLVALSATLTFAQTPQRMPMLPLTQLDSRALAADLDNRAFTLTFAQPVPANDLLLLLVRGTSLSIVPDPSTSGSFIGELKNVTVRQALGLILRPLGLEFTVDGTFIRVFRREPETRIFDLNYIATERVSASTVGGTGAAGPGTTTLSTSTRTDVFGDLAKGVQTLLSEHATFNVDRKAGLLQVTDVPERLDRVSIYLDAVQDRIQRQVQIDARVIEVELNDEGATGVDWQAVATKLAGEQTAAPPAVSRGATGLRVTDVTKLMAALAEQGTIVTIANPRLLALNNEPALVHTETVTFSVTAQIATDGIVTLSLSPIVRVPVLAESDMIARVADGETLVMSGFIREREVKERKAVGISGGWFGRTTVVSKKRLEMIILLTPRVVSAVAAQ